MQPGLIGVNVTNIALGGGIRNNRLIYSFYAIRNDTTTIIGMGVNGTCAYLNIYFCKRGWTNVSRFR